MTFSISFLWGVLSWCKRYISAEANCDMAWSIFLENCISWKIILLKIFWQVQRQTLQIKHSRGLGIYFPMAHIWIVFKYSKKKINLKKKISQSLKKKNQQSFGEFTFSHFLKTIVMFKQTREIFSFSAIQNWVVDCEEVK